VRLNGVTKEPRTAAVAAARDALLRRGAFITDYREFSNVSVCIHFECEGADLRSIAKALAGARFGLSAESVEALWASIPEERQVKGMLQLTFVHGEPDLKQTIPAVPG